MKTYAFHWLLMAVPVTAMFVGMYAVGQQVLRQQLNDVPVQLAEDIGAQWDQGNLPASTTPVEMSRSLAPWYVVYDQHHAPIAGTGNLHGKLPILPEGIFEHADFWAHGHSWQPEPGVREDIAVYVVGRLDHNEYVVAGRSMSETERHIEHVGYLVLLWWIATLVVMSVLQLLYVFGGRIARRRAR